jgi:hypothetical protein
MYMLTYACARGSCLPLHPVAMLLVDEILSGRLYNGKAMGSGNNYVYSYIKNKFRLGGF